MRKKGIILMLALTGLFISCNDAIDIKQPGEQNDPYEVFKNARDIERGLSGIYISLPGESEIEFDSVFTDEVSVGMGNGGQGLISGEFGFFMQPANDFAGGIWSSYYGIINRVNRLLEITDKLIATTTDVAEVAKLKDHKSELLGLRAFANLKLFAYFTPDYTNPSGFSIMKLDFVPNSNSINEYIGRSTVSEIAQFIIDDIDESLDIRTNAWSLQNTYYLTAGVLRSMKVKLFSMTRNYTEMIPLAEDIVINGGGVYGYKFAGTEQYIDMFKKDPNDVPNADLNKEYIFRLARPLGSGGSVASAWYSSAVSPTGAFFYEMGRSLYNDLDRLDPASQGQAYTDTRNDVRYNVNVLQGSTVATNYASLPQAQYISGDILLIGKFKGQSGAFPAALKNDIPVIRYSDIALLLAEARAANGQFGLTSTDPDDLLGDFSTVENIIYNLRYNRSRNVSQISMPTVNSTQSAFKAILDERRVEFAYEGHRYLDMKRIGQRAGSVGFERYSKDCVVNGACNLPVSDHRMTLPIPTSELNANPTIKNQQNPGY